MPLYHLDLYRLSEDSQSVSELLATELDQFIDQKMIAVIEWADLFTLGVYATTSQGSSDAPQRSYFDQLDHLVVDLQYVEEVKPSEEGQKNFPSFYMENGRKANLTAFGVESGFLISRLESLQNSHLKIL